MWGLFFSLIDLIKIFYYFSCLQTTLMWSAKLLGCRIFYLVPNYFRISGILIFNKFCHIFRKLDFWHPILFKIKYLLFSFLNIRVLQSWSCTMKICSLSIFEGHGVVQYWHLYSNIASCKMKSSLSARVHGKSKLFTICSGSSTCLS